MIYDLVALHSGEYITLISTGWPKNKRVSLTEKQIDFIFLV